MLRIRNAERADVAALKSLIDEMSEHERLQAMLSEQHLAADGFGPRPSFQALIASWDEQDAGYALFFDYYSSFQGRGIFLEDLYVREAFRGKSIGQALLWRIACVAAQRGDFGIFFNVLEWNVPAMDFFRKAGASLLVQRKTLCLAGEALRDLASKDPGAEERAR
jgi:GNAT superfamily N-acetyltransferase